MVDVVWSKKMMMSKLYHGVEFIITLTRYAELSR